MDELKKRAFALELTDEDLTAFIRKCYQDGTTPAEVLEGFINDLIAGSRTRGSDERMYAGQYYERCGYGFFFSGEYQTFTQLLPCCGPLSFCFFICSEKLQFSEAYTRMAIERIRGLFLKGNY